MSIGKLFCLSCGSEVRGYQSYDAGADRQCGQCGFEWTVFRHGQCAYWKKGPMQSKTFELVPRNCLLVVKEERP